MWNGICAKLDIRAEVGRLVNDENFRVKSQDLLFHDNVSQSVPQSVALIEKFK
jgi:hypothetical protein